MRRRACAHRAAPAALLPLLVLVPVLVATACAPGAFSDEGFPLEAGDPALEAAIADALVTAEPDRAGAVTAEQAACVATAIVTGVGAEDLADYGVTVDEVPPLWSVDWFGRDGDRVAEAVEGCIDLEAVLLAELEARGATAAQLETVGSLVDADLLDDLLDWPAAETWDAGRSAAD